MTVCKYEIEAYIYIFVSFPQTGFETKKASVSYLLEFYNLVIIKSFVLLTTYNILKLS